MSKSEEHLHIRIPVEMKERIKEIAENYGFSMSTYVKHLLLKEIEKREEKK